MTSYDSKSADATHTAQPVEEARDMHQDSSMTPQQASALLAQAERSRSAVPATIPSAIVTLGVLCATGTFGTLAFSFAEHVPTMGGFAFDARLAVIVLLIVWIAVAVAMPLLFRAPWRKGLAKRWMLYLFLWTLLWVFALLMPAPVGLGMSAMFIALFGAACGTEAKHARARQEA